MGFYCMLFKRNLTVYYRSRQVLVANVSVYEMQNTTVLLNVPSTCVFSGKKPTLYQELSDFEIL